jgi:hypothetical protein
LRPTLSTVAADGYERQLSIGNNLAIGAITTADIDVGTAKSNSALRANGSAALIAPASATTRCPFFQHFNCHHSKQRLVFYQEDCCIFFWTTQSECPRSTAAIPL